MEYQTDVPNINEISEFLTAQTPDIYRALAGHGDEYAAALQQGVWCGVAEENGGDEVRTGLQIRADILAAALAQALVKAHVKSGEIRGKLRKLRMLKFVVGVFTAIGATGAAGTALVEQQTLTVILSLVTLTSTIVNEAAQTLVLEPAEKEADLIRTLNALSEASSFADLAQKYLAALSKSSGLEDDLVELLKDANLQFRQLNLALQGKTSS